MEPQPLSGLKYEPPAPWKPPATTDAPNDTYSPGEHRIEREFRDRPFNNSRIILTSTFDALTDQTLATATLVRLDPRLCTRVEVVGFNSDFNLGSSVDYFVAGDQAGGWYQFSATARFTFNNGAGWRQLSLSMDYPGQVTSGLTGIGFESTVDVRSPAPGPNGIFHSMNVSALVPVWPGTIITLEGYQASGGNEDWRLQSLSAHWVRPITY